MAAAASSSPALAASAAQPAVVEDLTRERVVMLLLMAPREVWRREVPAAAALEGDDEGRRSQRAEVEALLDTAAHSGRGGGACMRVVGWVFCERPGERW